MDLLNFVNQILDVDLALLQMLDQQHEGCPIKLWVHCEALD